MFEYPVFLGLLMKFVTNKREDLIRSKEHLLELVERALRKQTKFFVGEDRTKCLQVATFSCEGVVLELHRGKRWEGWVSPNISKHEEVGAIFADYFATGDVSSERLKQLPEWIEMEAFHPAVYIIAWLALMGAVLYCNYRVFFKRR